MQECLRRNGLAAAHLAFELTETAAVGNLAQASELMARLQALGCPIALDDFGSGMSSFSYLKALASIGVDFVQGYHLHRPAPLTEIARLRPQRADHDVLIAAVAEQTQA